MAFPVAFRSATRHLHALPSACGPARWPWRSAVRAAASPPHAPQQLHTPELAPSLQQAQHAEDQDLQPTPQVGLQPDIADDVLFKRLKIPEWAAWGPLVGRDVGNVLYPLHGRRDCEEVRAVLRALAPRIAACAEPLTARSAGTALYGLLRCGDTPEARQVIASLTPRLVACTEKFSALNISNALYSLGHRHESVEVRELISAITTKVVECQELFTEQNLSNALYGLQRCGFCSEVDKLLSALVPHIVRCPNEFTPQAIATSLFGLQRVEDNAPLRAVLAALTPHIERCSEPFIPKLVGMALSGLQKCSDCGEFRGVLKALVPKVIACEGTLDSEGIGTSFLALKACRESSPEARALLGALGARVEERKTPIKAKHLVFVFIGLRDLSKCAEGRAALGAVARHVAADPVSLKPYASVIAAALQDVPGAEAQAVREALGQEVVDAGPRRQARRSRQVTQSDDSTTQPDQAGGPQLPPGWTQHRRGKDVYYYHAEHGSQWSVPGAVDDLPAGWVAYSSPKGTYYHHAEHGSQWEVPR